MNRIFDIQERMLAIIAEFADSKERDETLNWERIHMVSCARIGQLLALKRGVDPELAAVACAVHDFGRIITGRQAAHAAAGCGPVKEFLARAGFSPEEIELIAWAVQNHSNKKETGTLLEEVVKDADVLDCYQYGQPLSRPEQQRRLEQVLTELNLK